MSKLKSKLATLSIMQLSLLLVTLCFLLISRLYKLNSIPVSIPHDEMVYAVQAQSYAIQGSTLNQLHKPWYIKPFDHLYAELPATFMSIGFLLSSNPLIGTHMTSALMGVSFPFILAGLFWNVWQKKNLSIAIFIVTTFNPLFWQFSRLGYDAWYSLWFYILGASLLTHKKKQYQWLSLVIFFIGFFNYQGFKLLLVPFTTLFLGLQLSQKLPLSGIQKFTQSFKKILLKENQYVVAVLFSGLLTLFFVTILLPSQNNVGSRLDDIVFSDTQMITDQVNLERRQALISPLTQIITNKHTGILHFMYDRFLSAFNLHLLFMQIEPDVSGFSVWTHGIFYWIEGLLILLGASTLLKDKNTRLSGILLLLAVPVFSLPTLINTGSEWHLLRTMLSYTILLFMAAWGLYSISEKKLPLILFTLIYVFSILHFGHEYFYRYPVISADWSNYHERLVARYIQLVAQKYPEEIISIHTSQPNYYYWSHLLYNHQIKKENFEVLKHNADANTDDTNNQFVIGNVIFSNSCDIEDEATIIIAESSFRFCKSRVSNLGELSGLSAEEHSSRKYNSLVALLDSGEKMYMLDDPLCQHMKLKNFVYPTSLADLNVESQNLDTFCYNWITYQ